MNALDACLRKRAYPTLAQAAATAAWLRHNKGHPVGAYRCPVCRKFHLGRRGWKGERRAA